jgi:UDP-N-acetylglucosamine 3-dehydrogenase
LAYSSQLFNDGGIMKSKTLKGCIVGAGYVGKIHNEAYRNISEIQITAVADNNQGKAAELAQVHNGKGYQNYLEMIQVEKPDFVDVCLPSRMHRAAVVAALEASCNVIVEKPFALELDDIDVMIAAALCSGKRLMVAHVCRFMPQYVHAKKIITENSLGKPLFFNCWRNSETPGWSWDSWILKTSLSGGTIMDLSIHDIDITNWFFGIPQEYRAFESVHPVKEGPSHILSILDYPDRIRASVEAGHLMPKAYPFTVGYRLLFERGIVEWNSRETGSSLMRIFTDDREEKVELSGLPSLTPKGKEGLADPYAEELAHFAHCLLTGEAFTIEPGDARLAVETVLKLKQHIS